jgi:TolB-like protein/Tfp pilus assembly protein PilF
MGQVWAAHDTQSDEDVAVKVIRPELTANSIATVRFRQELQLARKIAHVNVCRVNEIFEDHSTPLPRLLLTMELLEGETLAAYLQRVGQLPSKEALPLAAQIVDGLAAAHRLEIVHGDLKPGNIMLVPSSGGWRAVIMDFGLARVEQQEPRGTQPEASVFPGTPDYMAPEQVERGRITPATDVYALGLTFFEMITGRKPLQGRSDGKTPGPRAPRLRKVVPGTDARMESIVWRCLELEPADRYTDAMAVQQAMAAGRMDRVTRRRRVLAGSAALLLAGAGGWLLSRREKTDPLLPGPLRISVVPFEPIGDTKEQQYLADGLTERILTALQQRGFDLPGRGSAFSYQGRSVPLDQIARELGVEWLLSGTIRLQGGKVAVYAQLVDAHGTPGRWSKKYAGDRGELRMLGQEIASEAARVLAPSLPQRSVALDKALPEASDLYLRGRYHFERRDPADQNEALRLFREAVKLDSKFALAHCGIAEALASMADLRQEPAEEALTEARKEALEAIRLDPELGHGYAVFANILVLRDADAEAAITHFDKAIALDPNDVLAYLWYSHLLLKIARVEACMRKALEAFRRDPLNLRVHYNTATTAYFTRRYSESYSRSREVLEKAPDYHMGHELLCEVCARLGKRKEAIAEAEAALHQSRQPAHALSYAANMYAILGDHKRATELLEKLFRSGGKMTFEAVHVARAYAEMGQTKEAMRWLETARARKETGLQTVRIHHSYDPIRETAEFREFARELPFGKMFG